jgi:hypothetical protein
MNPYEFSKLCASTDKEAPIGVLFDEAHDIWDEEGRDALTEGQITVLAVETFFGEILNGGFYQYFFNQSGGLAAFAPAALRRVGLGSYAPVLETFLALFPGGKPADAGIGAVSLFRVLLVRGPFSSHRFCCCFQSRVPMAHRISIEACEQ